MGYDGEDEMPGGTPAGNYFGSKDGCEHCKKKFAIGDFIFVNEIGGEIFCFPEPDVLPGESVNTCAKDWQTETADLANFVFKVFCGPAIMDIGGDMWYVGDKLCCEVCKKEIKEGSLALYSEQFDLLFCSFRAVKDYPKSCAYKWYKESGIEIELVVLEFHGS